MIQIHIVVARNIIGLHGAHTGPRIVAVTAHEIIVLEYGMERHILRKLFIRSMPECQIHCMRGGILEIRIADPYVKRIRGVAHIHEIHKIHSCLIYFIRSPQEPILCIPEHAAILKPEPEICPVGSGERLSAMIEQMLVFEIELRLQRQLKLAAFILLLVRPFYLDAVLVLIKLACVAVCEIRHRNHPRRELCHRVFRKSLKSGNIRVFTGLRVGELIACLQITYRHTEIVSRQSLYVEAVMRTLRCELMLQLRR